MVTPPGTATTTSIRTRADAGEPRRPDRGRTGMRADTCGRRPAAPGGLLNDAELAGGTGFSIGTPRRYFEYLRISYQSIPFCRPATSI